MIFRLLVKGNAADAIVAAQKHGFPTAQILSATQKETRLEVDAWNTRLVYDWFNETGNNPARFLPGTLLHFYRVENPE